MGGSGTRSYTPSEPRNSCSELVFQATVNSPQASVIAGLVVGEELKVVKAPSGAAVHILRKKTLVGALTGTRVAGLINCIDSGFRYKATVITIAGGQCVVRVEAE